MGLHQGLQAFGQRGFAAAHRTQEIEDLLAFLQALRRMPEKADNAFDGLLHAVEFGKGRINLDGAIEEDPRQADILGGIDDLRFADGGQHAFMGTGIGHGVDPAEVEIGFQ